MIYKQWKPYGITSNAFAHEMKTYYGTDRVCYAGRLDPLARGEMMILTDEDVKDMTRHLKHGKTYDFKLVLGIGTVSSDVGGKILSTQNMKSMKDLTLADLHNKSMLQSLLQHFITTYKEQQYPIISSFVMRHGQHKQPLWWFYKNNIDVTPPTKQVEINNSIIHDITYINATAFINTAIQRLSTVTQPKASRDLDIISCINQYVSLRNAQDSDTEWIQIGMSLSVSSGFYIRQFCHDFGKSIGVPCIAFDITRTRIH